MKPIAHETHDDRIHFRQFLEARGIDIKRECVAHLVNGLTERTGIDARTLYTHTQLRPCPRGAPSHAHELGATLRLPGAAIGLAFDRFENRRR